MDPRVPGPFKYGRWTFSHEPIYVGMGNKTRPYEHLRGTHNKVFAKALRSIADAELKPLIEIKKTDLLPDDAYQLEVRLIRRIGRRNLNEGPLTNLTDCTGDGPKRVGVDTRKKLSDSATSQMSAMTFAEREFRRLAIADGLKKAYASGLRTDPIEVGERISKSKRERGNFFERMDDSERKAYSEKRSESSKRTQILLKNDPARLEEFRAKVSEGSKKTHANMTDAQKLARAGKIRQSVLARYAAMTDEDRAARNENIRIGMRK
jgi:hypothetical protein